ncbi:hypothetical protein NDU88_008509 [Pleurodeles waltl]|uniref:Secreted protein n=1 Tax=Pleurodeles waltl TaxID=8319 RepID=A0AAV7PWD8_PLEWA|nr:hypothetical protein NDU88_008509 [Pleurodeles waltl]
MICRTVVRVRAEVVVCTTSRLVTETSALIRASSWTHTGTPRQRLAGGCQYTCCYAHKRASRVRSILPLSGRNLVVDSTSPAGTAAQIFILYCACPCLPWAR